MNKKRGFVSVMVILVAVCAMVLIMYKMMTLYGVVSEENKRTAGSATTSETVLPPKGAMDQAMGVQNIIDVSLKTDSE